MIELLIVTGVMLVVGLGALLALLTVSGWTTINGTFWDEEDDERPGPPCETCDGDCDECEEC